MAIGFCVTMSGTLLEGRSMTCDFQKNLDILAGCDP